MVIRQLLGPAAALVVPVAALALAVRPVGPRARLGSPSPGRRMVNVTEAAAALGLSRDAAYAMINAGNFPIPVQKLGPRGGRFGVLRADLDAYLGGTVGGSRHGGAASLVLVPEWWPLADPCPNCGRHCLIEIDAQNGRQSCMGCAGPTPAVARWVPRDEAGAYAPACRLPANFLHWGAHDEPAE